MTVATATRRNQSEHLADGRLGLWSRLRMLWLLAGLLRRQLLIKRRAAAHEHEVPPRSSRVPLRLSGRPAGPVCRTGPDAVADEPEEGPARQAGPAGRPLQTEKPPGKRRPAGRPQRPKRFTSLRSPLSRLVRAPLRKLRAFCTFLSRMSSYNRRLLRLCTAALEAARARRGEEVVLYGDGEAARILCALAKPAGVRVRAVCPAGPPLSESRRRCGREMWSEERLAESPGPVIVAAFVNSSKRLARLAELGIPRERIITIS